MFDHLHVDKLCVMTCKDRPNSLTNIRNDLKHVDCGAIKQTVKKCFELVNKMTLYQRVQCNYPPLVTNPKHTKLRLLSNLSSIYVIPASSTCDIIYVHISVRSSIHNLHY